MSDSPTRLPGYFTLNDFIEPMNMEDWDEVIQLDTEVVGANRDVFLKSRFPVMMRNATELPEDRSRLYAIAAQAFG